MSREGGACNEQKSQMEMQVHDHNNRINYLQSSLVDCDSTTEYGRIENEINQIKAEVAKLTTEIAAIEERQKAEKTAP